MSAAPPISPAVMWHDVECGGYEADLPLWRRLARDAGGPVLDVGAGTGRVALRLAQAGHAVTALDRDPLLLSVLGQRARAAGLRIATITADAASFDLRGFMLIAVPMQTVQLLPGPEARASFLAAARKALEPGGLVAAALADAPEPFEAPGDLPLPDMGERDGWRFVSQPISIRLEEGRVWRIERARQTIAPDGTRTTEPDVVELAAITAEDLHREGERAGLTPAGVELVDATADHVGSEVVLLRA